MHMEYKDCKYKEVGRGSARKESLDLRRMSETELQDIVLACLVATALADTGYYAAPPASSGGGGGRRVVDVVPIIRDDRVHPDAAGIYSFDVETGDGIRRSEQGGHGGSQQGKVSFTFPDGQVFDLSFVADANGYQPESPFLPVAPAFPHPIPQFVLDQIEFARQQDEARARGGSGSTPSRSYGAPN
ncbi:endocuticle structural glycoprotein SgAbd-8-like [Oratosquilla oratoria]|uniref:endocuticle structural glycoprotein SgAbd-8-like n=1 Tax=Oratosquilla oratoria TaxID=337810 RepID=UPI003F75C9CC